MPTISRIYSGQGRLIDEFAKERRLFAPANTIPDLIKQAFISAEDKNFYSHPGVDPEALARAALLASGLHKRRRPAVDWPLIDLLRFSMAANGSAGALDAVPDAPPSAAAPEVDSLESARPLHSARSRDRSVASA